MLAVGTKPVWTSPRRDLRVTGKLPNAPLQECRSASPRRALLSASAVRVGLWPPPSPPAGGALGCRERGRSAPTCARARRRSLRVRALHAPISHTRAGIPYRTYGRRQPLLAHAPPRTHPCMRKMHDNFVPASARRWTHTRVYRGRLSYVTSLVSVHHSWICTGCCRVRQACNRACEHRLARIPDEDLRCNTQK